jgi:hypothetical protein
MLREKGEVYADEDYPEMAWRSSSGTNEYVVLLSAPRGAWKKSRRDNRALTVNELRGLWNLMSREL